jgi:hypothetical protein
MTKQKKAIIITTVLYNMNHPACEKDRVAWKHVKKLIRQPMDFLDATYLAAIKALDTKKYPPEFFGLGVN